LLPLLRKDFMIDPYQAVEARAWGADCVLLIMACLSDTQAAELAETARAQSLDVLVEVHTAKEMERAINLNVNLIGINNRNLRTFDTDIHITGKLAPLAPPHTLIVSESGVKTNADLVALAAMGAKAFLVGESLMRQGDLQRATQDLLYPQSAA
jgi:indole-3-glycerol phosphate synthase